MKNWWNERSTRLWLAVAPALDWCITVIEGGEYTSRAYQFRLEQAGMSVSMSCKGNCWDNAAMESFFGSFKEECVGSTISVSHDEARLAIFTYLEVYYNRIRRHSTLGYVSPVVYEQRGKSYVERTV